MSEHVHTSGFVAEVHSADALPPDCPICNHRGHLTVAAGVRFWCGNCGGYMAGDETIVAVDHGGVSVAVPLDESGPPLPDRMDEELADLISILDRRYVRQGAGETPNAVTSEDEDEGPLGDFTLAREEGDLVDVSAVMVGNAPGTVLLGIFNAVRDGRPSMSCFAFVTPAELRTLADEAERRITRKAG